MINKRKALICILVSIIMFTMTTFPVVTTPKIVESIVDRRTVYDLTSGYADDIYFRVITGDEQQVLALQAGEIDLIGKFVSPDLVPPLLTDPNIMINQTNRRGFGHISFNCEKAPTNWTELRVAFAYALDKDAIQVQALGGYSRPVDSPIPPSMGDWSLDNHPDFVKNYYEPDPVTGNAILDAAGFIDLDSDGWREDPNGNPINFGIMGANVGLFVVETVIAISVDAFDSLHIQTYMDLIDFNTLLARIDIGDYNAGFWAFNMGGTEPLFLENFQSDNFGNDWNFYNTTYDDLVDTMLESEDENEVYEACWDAQRILWEEQPLVVAYQNLLISAYRKDPWEGYVNTEGAGVFEDWTFLKVRLKVGYGTGEDYNLYTQGGSFTVSLPGQMESTNILNSNSAYTHMPLDLVYDTLYRQNPYSLEDCAWLATDWLVEEVDPADLAATPRAEAGDLTKITYYLNPEAIYWHDGVELTSEDVAYSYELVSETNSPVYLTAVQDVTHVETPDAKTVEIFCDTGGLFTLHRTSLPVFPKHIWETVETPLTWSNPVPVGSGPYKWKSRTPGELVVLERNDYFIYNPRNYGESSISTTLISSIITTTTTTSTTTITALNNPPMVTILYPNGGEKISGSFMIMWSGYDSDLDPVDYDLYVSPDGGVTWIQLADDITQSYYDWDTSFYFDGDNYLIRVTANDGIDSNTDVSDSVFSLVNGITESSTETIKTSTETTSTSYSNPFSTGGFEIIAIGLSLPVIAVHLNRKKKH